ncbi:hypothetical protein CDL15_Pgr020280 [Punica granatum]|uniref:J domain-containing protein n=1 Tax=Punica granatum TaxID=22663 RepID=A0A218VRK8_PUNGR|nr:hypothetical protein CDL15_Pgr020280 [Punica granatum]
MAQKNTGTTLYEVLNVMSTASQSEIKAAYRRLAKLYHPDSASLESDGGRDFRKYATYIYIYICYFFNFFLIKGRILRFTILRPSTDST